MEDYLVKICGNVYPDESRKVAAFRPDFMGWIFAPSARRVSVLSAATQIRMVRRTTPSIMHVIVVARYSPDQLVKAVRKMADWNAEPDAIQVVENAAYIARLESLLRKDMSDIPIIPVLRPTEPLTDENFISRRAGEHPFFVVDAYDPEKSGGTGRAVEAEFLKNTNYAPYLLAGGLNPENVKQKLESVNSIGADVSSGVETGEPGRKDEKKLEQFIANVRALKQQ